MVARINHGAHVEGVLFYNKLKTDKGEARVVLCHNLPIVPQDGNIDIRRLSEAFRPWMTHPRSRLREPVFHVSLNPNPKDRIDEMKMLEIAHYYMERMGYGDQPYVIFEHNDIERKHYHIVSSRIKPDGTTIDSFEYKKRSKALTEEIEREFNLIPTVLGQQSAAFEELRKVEYAQSNLKAQLSSVLYNLTDRYRFSSKGECTTLLKIFNIWMEECKGEVEGRPYAGIIYGALDEHGQRVGKPIKSSRISKKFGYKALQKEYSKTKRWIAGNKQKLEPTRITIREAMKTARTTEEFAAAIRPGGISVVFHRSAEHENRIYGVTFIDHRNGLVINGSRSTRLLRPTASKNCLPRLRPLSLRTVRSVRSRAPTRKMTGSRSYRTTLEPYPTYSRTWIYSPCCSTRHPDLIIGMNGRRNTNEEKRRKNAGT